MAPLGPAPEMVSNDRSELGCSRATLETVGGGQFVELALGRLLFDPFEETRDGRAVAGLGALLPGDLGRILDRLGQHRRVAQRQDLGAGLLERFENRPDRALGVDRDGLALEVGERGLEFRPLVDANAIAEVLADRGIDLLSRDEQVGGAVGVDDRKPGDRGGRHSAPRTLTAQAISRARTGPRRRRWSWPASRRCRCAFRPRSCPHIARAGRPDAPWTLPAGRPTPRRSGCV